MELVNQHNLLKIEFKRLHDMLSDKLNEMKNKNAPRHYIKRVLNERNEIQRLLRNHFDLYNTGSDNLKVACIVGDNY